MKITSKQKEIILCMKNGWELGKYSGINPNVCIQHNGIGHGGSVKYFSMATFDSIVDKKLIEPKPVQSKSYLVTIYQLTELGQSINL